MKRVMILGCAGAGKSTFARKLGAAIGAPVVHMDALFWKPGWVQRETEDFRQRLSAAIAGESWVVEGNYFSRTLDLRAPRADKIIWLQQPRWRCLQRVIARSLRDYGRTRADMGEGCAEKLDAEFLLWIWNWKRDSRPRYEGMLAKYDVADRTIHLTGDREATSFLAGACAQAVA